MLVTRINAHLDAAAEYAAAPRLSSMSPFLACGITGVYAGGIIAVAGVLLRGLSPAVFALLCLVASASFFAYVFVRRWMSGREHMVLLDQFWLAELSAVVTLAALRQPILTYLDVLSVGLCVFFAFGRVGCLLAGCCHGRPSACGIRYPARVGDGTDAYHTGVRLFPVQLVETVALASIGISGLAALPQARDGVVLAWILAAYAVLRFGAEGLRGDVCLRANRLSRARWMSIIQFGIAALLAERIRGSSLDTADSRIVSAALLIALIAALLVRAVFDHSRRMLSTRHREALRSQTQRLRGEVPTSLGADGRVARGSTAEGVTIGLSLSSSGAYHASLALPERRRDLALLAELFAVAFPTTDATSAQFSDGGVLHAAVYESDDGLGGTAPAGLARAVWWHAARRAQERPAIAIESPGASDTATSASLRARYFRGGPVA